MSSPFLNPQLPVRFSEHRRPRLAARSIAAVASTTCWRVSPGSAHHIFWEAAHEPVVATLVQRFGINPNILHGRIDYIGGRPLGIITLIAEGGSADLADVRNYLSSLNLHGEVIGHVVRSASAGARRAFA